MPKVLLINPPWYKKSDNIWSSISSVTPPIGIAGIASFLENHGFDVAILDMHALKMPVCDLVKFPDIDNYEVVGITCTTPLIAVTAEIVELLRNIVSKNTKIVLGGVHPTVATDECLMIKGVDCVVKGEGEETILEILEGGKRQDIPGMSYRENGHIVHNQSRPPPKEIDELPFPAYHLLPMRAYRPALGAFKQLPGIGIITSRGCPGKCTFCYKICGSSLRLRSPGSVIAEIMLLRNKYGIREISFYDDTFTASKKRVMQICEMLIKEDMGVTWSCFARVDFIDQEMLFMMKKSGCHQIMYGIESASNEILQNINKQTDLEQAKRAIEWTKKAKIDVRAAFMLGSPGETEETLKETYEFAVSIDPEIVVFNITTPFPGTEMFEWAQRNKYLITEDWKDYDLAHAIMELPTISHKRVKEVYHSMYRRFYWRPSYIIKRCKRMISPLQMRVTIQAAWGIIGLCKKK